MGSWTCVANLLNEEPRHRCVNREDLPDTCLAGEREKAQSKEQTNQEGGDRRPLTTAGRRQSKELFVGSWRVCPGSRPVHRQEFLLQQEFADFFPVEGVTFGVEMTVELEE